MAVSSGLFLICKHKNILVNRNLAQATVRESDDPPHPQFMNKNLFMNLYALYKEKVKVVLEGFYGNIILPTLVLAFHL